MFYIYSVIDYLKFYKDKAFSEVHWNEMDTLCCAILAYLPIESFKGGKGITDFTLYAEKFREHRNESNMAPVAYEVLQLISLSQRFRNVRICNFINNKNRDAQFGAFTLRTGKETVIAFKGSDYSVIGWLENFRIIYSYPTKTHLLAIDYLNRNGRFLKDKNIYVTGHSKGGNLALVSSMEADRNVRQKIKKIYNFDGPGLRKEEIQSDKYSEIAQRLENIMPAESVVGVLLYNQNYKPIKSSAIAVYSHNPATWEVFGECFVREEFSGIGKWFHEKSTKGLEKLRYSEIEDAFETIFQSMDQSYTENMNISLENLSKFHKNMKNVDSDVRENINIILKSMLEVNIKLRRAEKVSAKKNDK